MLGHQDQLVNRVNRVHLDFLVIKDKWGQLVSLECKDLKVQQVHKDRQVTKDQPEVLVWLVLVASWALPVQLE